MNKEQYQQYLKTAHWQSVRAIKIYSVGSCCENCHSEKLLQVHHLNYDNLYHEKNEDLKVLCEFCHKEIEHGGDAAGYNTLVAHLAEAKRFRK